MLYVLWLIYYFLLYFRVANILVSSMRFHSSYRNNLLKPDVFHMQPSKTNTDTFWRRTRFFPGLIATPLAYAFKVFPLDMYQHPNLFQSTRLPKPERDAIQKFPDAKHMLIIRKGHFYTFPVYDENWNIFPPAYYLKVVRQIMSDKAPESSGIGVFTSDDRDRWTELRRHLENNLGNSENLEKIDSALFAICLDDDWTHNEEKQDDSVRNLVSGIDPANRWFDKSFSKQN